jgi:hypothetical protein
MPNETTEPMSGEQATLLQRLSKEAREPEAFAEHLSSAAAAQRIEVLRSKLAKDVSGSQHKPE